MNDIQKYIHWILRIYLAYALIPSGYKKLGLMYQEMKIVGYLVGPFELIGPLFLLIGALTTPVLTRVGAAMIAIIMIGAIYFHVIIWAHEFEKAYPALLLLVFSLIFLIRGNKVID